MKGYRVLMTLLVASGYGYSAAAAETQLAIRPDNVVTASGDTVSLTCQADDGSLLSWSFCTQRNLCEFISVGQEIIALDPEGRYDIYESPQKEFTLSISSVEPSDGTKYKCHVPTSYPEAFSEVVVIDPVLDCKFNLTNGALIEDDVTFLACHVAFKGRWPPSIRCRISTHDWLHGDDQSTSEYAQSRTRIRPDHKMDNKEVYCETYFEYPKAWDSLTEDEASNVPDMLSTVFWQSAPLIVLYGPKNLTISPRTAKYEVGQTVRCISSANPEPTYIWCDVTSGEVLADLPELTFTADQVGVLRVQCEASNTIQGVAHSEHLTLEVLVCDQDSCDSSTSMVTTIVVGAVLGSLLGISLVANIILATGVTGRRGNSHNQRGREDSKSPIVQTQDFKVETSDEKVPWPLETKRNTLPPVPTFAAPFYNVIHDDDVDSDIDVYIAKQEATLNSHSTYSMERVPENQPSGPRPQSKQTNERSAVRPQLKTSTRPSERKPQSKQSNEPSAARTQLKAPTQPSAVRPQPTRSKTSLRGFEQPNQNQDSHSNKTQSSQNCAQVAGTPVVEPRLVFQRRVSHPNIQTMDPETLARVKTSNMSFRDDSLLAYSRQSTMTFGHSRMSSAIPVDYVNQYELQQRYSDT